MNYTRPEVLLLGRAIDAVQGSGKPGGGFDLGMEEKTSGAYEADE